MVLFLSPLIHKEGCDKETRSYNPFTLTVVIGGIIRDFTGTLIISCAGKVLTDNALEAELKALIKGVELCLEKCHIPDPIILRLEWFPRCDMCTPINSHLFQT